MSLFRSLTLVAASTILVSSSVVTADAVSPFIESFDNDASNWRDLGGGADASWNPAGYISTSAAFADAGPFGLTLFRGQDAFDSSGDAFVGDWAAGGITHFSFDMRHNAAVPVNFFARFATPQNFPAFAGAKRWVPSRLVERNSIKPRTVRTASSFMVFASV